jgi:hypothetical protein
MIKEDELCILENVSRVDQDASIDPIKMLVFSISKIKNVHL